MQMNKIDEICRMENNSALYNVIKKSVFKGKVTCISICLGLSMYFSISILSSPKLEAASCLDKRKESL